MKDDNERFTGQLITRGDQSYETARTGPIFHSRHPQRFPAAILVAETENDVVEGVRLARERGWQVGIRSGGHSFPVWGVRDNALLIDLGALKEMSLDPDSGIVLVSPAVHGGDELTPYLKTHGRFFPTGGCPSVAMGGYLVQGGFGWNQRGWGYAAEQIAAIDVVTADGELVRADETQNSDLFWAARGAGPGFFGVITRFHLRTRAIPEGLMATMQVYRLDDYPRVLEWLCETNRRLSADVHLNGASANAPFPVPGNDGGYIFAVNAVAFCESPEDSRAALAPLAECPYLGEALLVFEPAPTTLEDQLKYVDSGHPPGLRYRVDNAFVEGPWDQVVAATQMVVAGRPSTEFGYTFFWFTLPHDGPDMAMSMQTDLAVGAYIIYEDEDEDEKYRLWSLEAFKQLEPYTVGQGWGDSDQQHREVKTLTDDNWTRLQEIRRRRDPDQLFVGYLGLEGGFRNINHWEERTQNA